MEEEVMMTMMTNDPENLRNETTCDLPIIRNTDCPSWKLYENPIYSNSQPHRQQQWCPNQSGNKNHLRRKIAASLWDLTFSKPIMGSELDLARTQIVELRAELEIERKARKKLEGVNKRLVKELAEEQRRREETERVCGELAGKISTGKAEIDRRRREMEEERKMMRVAEVLREERVQMKLTEAKILLEEKISELEVSKQSKTEPLTEQSSQEVTSPSPEIPRKLSVPSNIRRNSPEAENPHTRRGTKILLEEKVSDSEVSKQSKTEPFAEQSNQAVTSPAPSVINRRFSLPARLVLGEKSWSNDNIGAVAGPASQRRASPEAENPHIKRGIKGFVEFPRVVRAIGSKSRHWGSKLECQKAQLRILLKQKSSIGSSNNLIIS